MVLYSLAQKVGIEYLVLGLPGSCVAFKEEEPIAPFNQDEEDSGTRGFCQVPKAPG